jgi:glucosamine--fructose-6-phosphate aminotransferase (isomerizing)
MCGIFGIIGATSQAKSDFLLLARYSERRGRDSSGLYLNATDGYKLYRACMPVTDLLKKVNISGTKFAMGHTRLITNGLDDNQPVYRDSVCVVHNGIIVNDVSLWQQTNQHRRQEIDTEIIPALVAEFLDSDGSIVDLQKQVLSRFSGVVSCAIAMPKYGKLLLYSNNGSLYIGKKGEATYFASERYILAEHTRCSNVAQVDAQGVVLDIPLSTSDPSTFEIESRKTNLVPALGSAISEELQLKYQTYRGRRCTRCILPATMPFITFDDHGVCNYCRNYKIRNRPKPVQELEALLEPYRRICGGECIIPFSGGRDSCYGLHLVAKELKMKPITYTYDWGMVTDLGRRNISRMCAHLGIENIIVADDIAQKRRNIAKNLRAWLRSPHLGMVSILTAGDKHFFRHVETVKKQTGISLNLWGVNPLEVTYFKAGFLGIPPDFEEKRVYSHGVLKQLRYQALRFGAMLQSPRYFNRSLWDTLSGEYYRSFNKKTDYFHIFDYYRWDEKEIDSTLINEYDWETAPDTNTTWRIGDGTAALYNYIYYTVAGFTEHDTFRSNQIREGDLTREQALALVEDENRPRYPNIKWYLDAIGMEFDEVIPVINAIRPLHNC